MGLLLPPSLLGRFLLLLLLLPPSILPPGHLLLLRSDCCGSCFCFRHSPPLLLLPRLLLLPCLPSMVPRSSRLCLSLHPLSLQLLLLPACLLARSLLSLLLLECLLLQIPVSPLVGEILLPTASRRWARHCLQFGRVSLRGPEMLHRSLLRARRRGRHGLLLFPVLTPLLRRRRRGRRLPLWLLTLLLPLGPLLFEVCVCPGRRLLRYRGLRHLASNDKDAFPTRRCSNACPLVGQVVVVRPQCSALTCESMHPELA